MEIKMLVQLAAEAMKNAYVPYSNFRVGAALLTKSGKVYTGCNIENASYGATNCAERTAIFKAISEGEREFEAIAIIADTDKFAYPCGICRQVMLEFSKDRDLKIYVSNRNGEYKEYTIDELLPGGFTGDNMR